MKKYILKSIYTLAICAASLAWALPAYAACSNNMDGNPGAAAEIEYFTTDNVLRYCDSSNWVDMVYNGAIPPDSSSLVAFFSDFFAPPADEEDYVANAVEFEELDTDYLTRGADLTGVVDTKIFTGSVWFKSNTDKHQILMGDVGGLGQPNIWVQETAGNQVRIAGRNPAGTEVLRVDANMASISTNMHDGNWHHIMFSADLSDPTKRHVYIDGQAPSLSFATYVDDVFDHTEGEYTIGMATTAYRIDADLADFWIDFDDYIDLSVEANRRKFISAAGYPVNLGASGQTPTGTVPDIFLSGDTVDWHTNKGTGGGFTENGALTDGANVTSNGLIGHWKLDETATGNAIDFSTSGNDGTMTGGLDAATNSVPAPIETGLDLDGDDEIDAGNIGLLIGETEGSACGWLKIDDTDVLKDHAIVTEYSTNGWMLFVDNIATVSGNVNTVTFLAGGAGAAGRVEAASDTVQAGEWEHYCGTFSGGNFIRLYRNGALIASNTTSIIASIAGGTPNLVIGGVSLANTSRNAAGIVDDARVYNRVLSDDEVSALYDLGKDRASLVVHYELDETTGTNAVDSSIYGNDGAFGGGLSLANSIPSIINNGLDFDGNDDRIGIASNTTIDNLFDGGGSISYWQRTANCNNSTISFSKDEWNIRCRDGTAGETGYWFTHDFSGSLATWRSSNTTPDIPYDEWNHIVLMYNADSTANDPMLYVNGQLASLGEVTSPSGTRRDDAGIDLRIGNNAAGTTGINADFDDIRLYDRILTTDEIDALYDLSNGSLIAHWKLDEAPGTTAADSSGNGNTASYDPGGGTSTTTGVINQGVTATIKNQTLAMRLESPIFPDGPNEPFSVAGWVNITPGDTCGTLWSVDSGANNSGSNLKFIIEPGSISITGDISSTLINTSFTHTTGRWMHYTATYNGTRLRIFENGILIASGNRDIDVANNTLVIGSADGACGGGIVGMFDDFRVYDRVLPADEVADLVKTGTGGLIAHYKLDEKNGTTATDSSIFSNDGTMQNGLDASNNRVDGPMVTALDFDGVNDAIVGDSDLLGGETNASTCAWIKLNAETITRQHWILSDAALGSSEGWGLFVDDSAFNSGNTDTIVFIAESGPTGGRIEGPSDMIETDTWTHICSTFSGGQYLRLYKNGVQVAENTTSISASVEDRTASSFLIGGEWNGDAVRFDGPIDDVRVYNTTLTDAQVLELYNAGDPPIAVTDAGLVAHYKLDETSGTTATDSSGNANDGTMINMDGVSNTTAGTINTALDFNGSNDHINLGDTEFSSTDISVSTWVNFDSVDPITDQIVSKYDASLGNRAYVLTYRDASPRFSFSVSDDGTNSVRAQHNIAAETNRWYHLTGTFDSTTGTVSMYVDGILRDTNTDGSITSIRSNNIPVYIGRGNSSGDKYVDGQIDDVRIYDRVLNADEVQILAACTGPTGSYFYNFSENAKQWCDGIATVRNMGPELSATGAGCGNQNNTTIARMEYESGINSFVYCNSEYDVPIGRQCAAGYCGEDNAHKVVFTINNRLFQSDFSGVTGADALCQAHADEAGLSGDYDAWLADSNAASAPATRFSGDITGGAFAFYKTDGAKVADDWTDLTDGTLDSIMGTGAFGVGINEGGFDVFSNVATDGTQLGTTNTCSDYTANTGNFARGRRNVTNSTWTNSGTSACSGGQAFLYCFEQ